MAGIGVPPELPTVTTAADGVARCRWATETGRDLTAYHDREWGTPTHDETVLFEALVLTYFENGLSWATVFDKRDNFRKAFHGFNPAAVAAMTPDDVERLMADSLHRPQPTQDRSNAAQRSSLVEMLVYRNWCGNINLVSIIDYGAGPTAGW